MAIKRRTERERTKKKLQQKRNISLKTIFLKPVHLCQDMLQTDTFTESPSYSGWSTCLYAPQKAKGKVLPYNLPLFISLALAFKFCIHPQRQGPKAKEIKICFTFHISFNKYSIILLEIIKYLVCQCET